VSTEAAVAAAVTFVWLGMVLGISFLEAPLKFRAPDVTLRIGLGIGRLVFRALHRVEAVWALVLVATALVGDLGTPVRAALSVAIAVLVLQLALVRPRLSRRSDAVLSGVDAPRSGAHLAYVGLEVVKVGALVTGGVLLLAR